jgi:hypothetical protein
MDEAQYVIERHKMSRTQLRALKKRRPYFRSSVIDEAIAAGENYDKSIGKMIYLIMHLRHGIRTI